MKKKGGKIPKKFVDLYEAEVRKLVEESLRNLRPDSTLISGKVKKGKWTPFKNIPKERFTAVNKKVAKKWKE